MKMDEDEKHSNKGKKRMLMEDIKIKKEFPDENDI